MNNARQKSKASIASVNSQATAAQNQSAVQASDGAPDSANQSAVHATQADVEEFLLSLRMQTMQQMIIEQLRAVHYQDDHVLIGGHLI